MRTVPTLCASGAGIGIASIGLAVVREDAGPSKQHTHTRPSPHPPTSNPDMTAVAAHAFSHPSLDNSSPFAFSSPPQTARSVSEGLHGKTRSASARVGQKRTLTPRASFSMPTERAALREDGGRTQAGNPSTPNIRPRTWMRRLSSSMSNSHESTSTPISRPGSSAISHSNGSMAFSQAGSTTPIFPDNTPQTLPPNKLVKRSSSLRSTSGSPFLSSGSKLPLPVFRRPATSHQRSVTLQEQHSGTDYSDQMSIDGSSFGARDPQLSSYFVPRMASEDLLAMRRRNSSGIPNPIKRVYPDRKYKPLLVSARDKIRLSDVEMDGGFSSSNENMEVTRLAMEPSVASSPLPVQARFEESQAPRRSFSIGDLLSPQPLWRRPSQNRGQRSGTKLVRRGRPRVVSTPHEAMGSAFSRGNGTDAERPAKRRDLTDPSLGQRSIYSSSSSNKPTDSGGNIEIQLHLGAETPQSFYGRRDTPKTFGGPPTSSPIEQQRLPSANHFSTAAKVARVSAAHSEITVDSDSEYRSVGDASTDYQSDAVYDSYPTRTTRSSSGRRGPHIETIFDESPPEFSSGRSNRLKDILDNGPTPHLEYTSQHRHSTIEEEGSILSTPVRSLRDRSLPSTPSARPGPQQLFTSSPPAMPNMPDADEIDWDAEDEGDQGGRKDTHQSLSDASWSQQKGLPFRAGPALQQELSPTPMGTPHRTNGTLHDRANLFDWSEVQPSPGQNQSPQRPRTVHGKKDPENRGSRSTGRRAPSGMHARSHSVPVVPDADGKRSNVVANKFGTWGVGSKAVTEDWNEDFDFDDDPPDPVLEDIKFEDKRIDSGHAMFVPKSIREQQDSVLANISLLREWGLLIEELKELRGRAVALEITNGPYAQDFQEVDAMIDLADQETEEATLQPRKSPPSSPGFDYGEFDEQMPNIAESAELPNHSVSLQAHLEAHNEELQHGMIQPSTPPHSFSGRPRKDSEAVARTVIEALQSKRSVSDPTADGNAPHSKKVPFDTATLRHIVPYVKDLKRKVKDALRETEGLYMTPRRRTQVGLNDGHDESDDEPAFRSIFNEPQTQKSPLQLSRRQQAVTDHDGAEDHFSDQRGDLADRMQGMSFPQ